MPSLDTMQAGSTDADWKRLFASLEATAKIPSASSRLIDRNHAVFRAMYLDLGQVKQQITDSNLDPPLVVLYADVLEIPDGLSWLGDGSVTMIVARRVQTGASASVALDFRDSSSTGLVLFTNELVGSITVTAVTAKEHREFTLDQTPPEGGVRIAAVDGTPEESRLSRAQGLPMVPTETFVEALRTDFLFASVLYDQQPSIALDMLTWVKDWAAESTELLGVFLDASSLLTLLASQMNARKNGAAFVPYLTSDVYTGLAASYVDEAQSYERDYMSLETQKVLTDKDIELAKALLDNKGYETKFVEALVAQAKSNYENALAAAEQANERFQAAKKKAEFTKIDFEKKGIPEWERKEIRDAVIKLATAGITFAVGIGAMLVGDEAGGATSAAAAVEGAAAVEQAAEAGSEIAEMAKQLKEVMSELKKIVDALQKIYKFLKEVMAAIGDLQNAGSLVETMQSMDVATGGADLSATYQWQVYQLAADASLKKPIESGVGYSEDLKLAIDELAVYGQALAAAQLAVIQAGQKYAALSLRQQLARREQARLARLVDSLKAGEAPIVAMMQQFYRRYLDAKSGLFAALEGYRASFFYWALEPSTIEPRIVDPVDRIDTGLKDLTSIALDRETALQRFSPPPQTLAQKLVVIDDPAVLADLRQKGVGRWTVALDNPAFDGFDRVRLDRVRVWLEGAKPGASGSINVMISTQGNYLDRFEGRDYQFVAKPLQRDFEYRVTHEQQGKSPDWKFNDGTYGYVEIDGSVDEEVAYAYFEPTPFGQWQIDLTAHNSDLDLSGVTRVTMELAGSVIAET